MTKSKNKYFTQKLTELKKWLILRYQTSLNIDKKSLRLKWIYQFVSNIKKIIRFFKKKDGVSYSSTRRTNNTKIIQFENCFVLLKRKHESEVSLQQHVKTILSDRVSTSAKCRRIFLQIFSPETYRDKSFKGICFYSFYDSLK